METKTEAVVHPAPTPTLPVHGSDDSPHPGRRALRARWRSPQTRAALRFAGPIVALVLGIKALVFAYGAAVPETVNERTFASFSERFSLWKAWDAQHYLSLAEHGYQTTGDAANFIVFFPGYPYTVRYLDYVVPGDLLVSAFAVSALFSIAAALLLGFLVRHDTDGDDEQATRAVWFFLIFPTAYFLHIPYTESLFLTLVLGSFVAARTGRWATAGIVGALAALTRINGIILLPALAVEAYLQYRKHGKVDPTFLWIGLIPVGLFIYLGINQHYFGTPFQFQTVQAEHWFKHTESPITSIKGMIERYPGTNPGDRQMLLTQELLFLAIGFAAATVAFFRTRASYAVWALLNVLLFASTSWIQSSPRYVLTIFPIFILLAQIKKPWVWMLVSAWSLAMMAWFMTRFSMGWWAF